MFSLAASPSMMFLLVPGYNGIPLAAVRQQPRSSSVAICCAFPVLSSNMDSITGGDMALAMARLGGLGHPPPLHVHRNQRRRVPPRPRRGRPGRHLDRGLRRQPGFAPRPSSPPAPTSSALTWPTGTPRWSNQTVRALRDKYGDNLCIIAGNRRHLRRGRLPRRGRRRHISSRSASGPGSVCTDAHQDRLRRAAAHRESSTCRKVDRPIIADGGHPHPRRRVSRALARGGRGTSCSAACSPARDETPGEKVTRGARPPARTSR